MATISATGDWALRTPVATNEGSSITQLDITDTTHDFKTGIAGGTQLYDEVSQFVNLATLGITTANLAETPALAAVDASTVVILIREVLASMQQQLVNGGDPSRVAT